MKKTIKSKASEISEASVAEMASMVSELGLKKHDKILIFCTNMGKPELSIPVCEKLGVKVTATVSQEIEILIGEYEGNPTLSIGKKNQSGKFYPYLTLGKSKAKLVIEHLEAIKAFAK